MFGPKLLKVLFPFMKDLEAGSRHKDLQRLIISLPHVETHICAQENTRYLARRNNGVFGVTHKAKHIDSKNAEN